MTMPVRIQRQRVKGYRLPQGAVYVGRPSIFGNPWSRADARGHGIAEPDRAAWCVRKYRDELDHGGLLSDWAYVASEVRWQAMADLFDELSPPTMDALGGIKVGSIRPLFRHLLRDATALACWCPLDRPCHADILVELMA